MNVDVNLKRFRSFWMCLDAVNRYRRTTSSSNKHIYISDVRLPLSEVTNDLIRTCHFDTFSLLLIIFKRQSPYLLIWMRVCSFGKQLFGFVAGVVWRFGTDLPFHCADMRTASVVSADAETTQVWCEKTSNYSFKCCISSDSGRLWNRRCVGRNVRLNQMFGFSFFCCFVPSCCVL